MSAKKRKTPGSDDEDDHPPPSPRCILISSTGPAADLHSDKLGVYLKTPQMTEGRHVYKQQDWNRSEGRRKYKLFSDKGVWVVSENYYEDLEGVLDLKAVAPSELPTTVKWQCIGDYDNWHDDPAMTVTGLNEEPRFECEVTISLSEEISQDIKDPAVAGEYRALGSYTRGRPVLVKGPYLLKIQGGCWGVLSCENGEWCLWSRSAPSMCPADPRAMRGKDEGTGTTHWDYSSKRGAWANTSGTERIRGESAKADRRRGISVTCNKCINK